MDTILIALQFHGESNTLGRSPAMSLHEALRAELARDLISAEREIDAAILRIRQADTDFLTAELVIEQTGCDAEQARAGLMRSFPELGYSELAARFWPAD